MTQAFCWYPTFQILTNILYFIDVYIYYTQKCEKVLRGLKVNEEKEYWYFKGNNEFDKYEKSLTSLLLLSKYLLVSEENFGKLFMHLLSDNPVKEAYFLYHCILHDFRLILMFSLYHASLPVCILHSYENISEFKPKEFQYFKKNIRTFVYEKNHNLKFYTEYYNPHLCTNCLDVIKELELKQIPINFIDHVQDVDRFTCLEFLQFCNGKFTNERTFVKESK